jgi:hypothetical protein
MYSIGMNVYQWGSSHQNRLLVECVAPIAKELLQSGQADRFWFDRFDARGPHVLILLASSSDSVADPSGMVLERLQQYLTTYPSDEVYSDEEVARRHIETQGKVLCEADRLPGLAPNNSLCSFMHGWNDYPYGLMGQSSVADELWTAATRLACWSIERLAANQERLSVESAVQLLAAVEVGLGAAGLRASQLWRYHACTLLIGLDAQLEADELSVLATLPALVGQENIKTLARVRDALGGGEDELSALVYPLVEFASGKAGWHPAHVKRWLREIVHWTLKQLGLPVSLHLPLLLDAWHRAHLREVVGDLR